MGGIQDPDWGWGRDWKAVHIARSLQVLEVLSPEGGEPGRRCSLHGYPSRLTHLGHTVMLYDLAGTYRGKQFSWLKDTQCHLEPRWVSSQAEKFLNTIRNSSNPLRF